MAKNYASNLPRSDVMDRRNREGRAAAVLRAKQRKEAKRLARIRKRRATVDKPGGDKE